jgi:hypothetical protein
MEQRLRELEQIASCLNSLVLSEDAIVHYDIYADGLIWSDELPNQLTGTNLPLSSLRPLLRYRTSLILSCPMQKYQYAWDSGLVLFPDWPGFDPGRRDRSLQETYHTLRDKALERFDEISVK